MSSFKKTLQPILQPILSSSLNSVGATSTPSLTAQVQAMFASYGATGGMYDITNMAMLFQDSAGTTPVTAASQPIAYVTDQSGSNWPLTVVDAGKRPLWDGNLGVFDGVDDFLATTALAGAARKQLPAVVGSAFRRYTNLLVNSGATIYGAGAINPAQSNGSGVAPLVTWNPGGGVAEYPSALGNDVNHSVAIRINSSTGLARFIVDGGAPVDVARTDVGTVLQDFSTVVLGAHVAGGANPVRMDIARHIVIFGGAPVSDDDLVLIEGWLAAGIP